tara:strand:- start:1653 stop:1979 length:327 start_codon:yes stop_codon:yes gene_type:complete
MSKIIVTSILISILFILMSPGMIINIPPYKNKWKTKYIFFTKQTTYESIIFHSLLFGFLIYALFVNYLLNVNVPISFIKFGKVVNDPTSEIVSSIAESLISTPLSTTV